MSDAALQAQDLTRRFGQQGRVGFSASPLGGVVATLVGSSGRAEVALKGAQVLSWDPRPGGEVLWCSPMGRLDAPRPLRGGIPVCWPWFGPHPNDGTQPAHGFARTALWQVAHAAAADAAASIRLELAGRQGAGLPGAESTTAFVDVTCADTLTVALTTLNYGSVPLNLTAALHTYLAIHEITEVTVQGLDGVTYIDQVDAGRRKCQSGLLEPDGETDRIYVGTDGPVTVSDPLFGRRLRVEREGSRSCVVWTPGHLKAERLGDVGDDGWRRFICIEAANAADDAVAIPPGGSHRLATTLSLELTG
jgi:D-hexose-6-phosphate mutarotase